MKHLYLLFCLSFLTIVSKAQTKAKTMDLGNIISDSASINMELGTKLGLASIKGSQSVIEIRLYSNIGFQGTQCMVLQYDKSWKATKYKLDDKGTLIKSTLKPAGGPDAIAKAIIGFNVFSLPTQASLNSGYNKLDLADNEVMSLHMDISDVPCYFIQFKVSNNSREYKYCGPKEYAIFYKGQHEYTDFSNILKAFAKLEVK